MTHYCIGLDLGKQMDYSALALLRWVVPRPGQPGPVYEVPTLYRWPLGTSYLEIVAHVARFHRALPEEARPVLVVDATGVGTAVYEMVRAELAKAGQQRGGCCAVTITAGSAVSLVATGRWRVAKKQLVSVLQVLLGQRRLHVAEGLPEARTLHSEFGTFSVKITESANETFESWRERDHDDLVLAVALACWAAAALPVFRTASVPDTRRLAARAWDGLP